MIEVNQDDARQKAGRDEGRRLRLPASQIAISGVSTDTVLKDPAIIPSRARLRPVPMDLDIASAKGLVSMATLITETDGGSLRTFGGGLAHENGWAASRKSSRLQHWQGSAQRLKMLQQETSVDTLRYHTEGVALEVAALGGFRYTADFDVIQASGRRKVIEVKGREADLECPTYRLRLAVVCEVLRRVDIDFEIVLRDEIAPTQVHRDNLELFWSRRFVAVGPHHLQRLESLAAGDRLETTYGRLCDALEPARPLRGQAVAQALLVRRRIDIDLTQRIHDATDVAIM